MLTGFGMVSVWMQVFPWAVLIFIGLWQFARYEERKDVQ